MSDEHDERTCECGRCSELRAFFQEELRKAERTLELLDAVEDFHRQRTEQRRKERAN